MNDIILGQGLVSLSIALTPPSLVIRTLKERKPTGTVINYEYDPDTFKEHHFGEEVIVTAEPLTTDDILVKLNYTNAESCIMSIVYLNDIFKRHYPEQFNEFYNSYPAGITEKEYYQ